MQKRGLLNIDQGSQTLKKIQQHHVSLRKSNLLDKLEKKRIKIPEEPFSK